MNEDNETTTDSKTWTEFKRMSFSEQRAWRLGYSACYDNYKKEIDQLKQKVRELQKIVDNHYELCVH